MEQKELTEYLDHQRWLLNMGLVSDDVKNQLFFCGSIIHKEVMAVEVDIVADKKRVNYRIYFNKDLIDRINKYHQLSKSTSLFGMWRFKRFLKKEGALDFNQILSKFVVDFCGPKWFTNVELKDFDAYVEEVGVHGEEPRADQQSNQLPD